MAAARARLKLLCRRSKLQKLAAWPEAEPSTKRTSARSSMTKSGRRKLNRLPNVRLDAAILYVAENVRPVPADHRDAGKIDDELASPERIICTRIDPAPFASICSDALRLPLSVSSLHAWSQSSKSYSNTPPRSRWISRARWRISSIFSPSLTSGLATRMSCVSNRSFSTFCERMFPVLSDFVLCLHGQCREESAALAMSVNSRARTGRLNLRTVEQYGW